MSEILEHRKDWLICHNCGEFQTIVALSPDHSLVCYNCNSLLHSGHGKWLNTATAVVVASLILFFISNFFPFLTLEVGGQAQTATILDGVGALIERNQWLLAGLVFTTIFLFPLFEIAAYLYLLIPYSMNKRLPGQHHVLRMMIRAQDWSMLEIFMLSVVVTSVKLTDMAELYLEPGAYAFFVLVGMLMLAYAKLDRRKLWAWMNTNNYYHTVENEYAYDCHICQALVGESIVDEYKSCPRCESELHRRIPQSMQKTFALILAATILYIPANLLPMMTYTSLGVTESDTIFSGVIELIAADLWWIATVVFIASIVVPIAKLVIMYYLLWAVHAKIRIGARHRAALYRISEIIGRWSMVDVFVVTLLVALVQFGFIYTVEPGSAIIAFGAVVVLTMIAVETFDPRLLWDAKDEAEAEIVARALESQKAEKRTEAEDAKD